MVIGIIKTKISKFTEYMSKLQAYVATPTDDILRNEEKRLSMERLFQLVVDEAIDINTALSYQISKRVSDSYRSSFYDLADSGAIEQNFAAKIAESTKVRNQIVHDYEKLEYREMIENIKKFYVLYEEYGKIIVNKYF